MSQTLLKHNESEQANTTKHKWGSVLRNVDFEDDLEDDLHEDLHEDLKKQIKHNIITLAMLTAKEPKDFQWEIEKLQNYLNSQTRGKSIEEGNEVMKAFIRITGEQIEVNKRIETIHKEQETKKKKSVSKPIVKKEPKKVYTKEELAELAVISLSNVRERVAVSIRDILRVPLG